MDKCSANSQQHIGIPKPVIAASCFKHFSAHVCAQEPPYLVGQHDKPKQGGHVGCAEEFGNQTCSRWNRRQETHAHDSCKHQDNRTCFGNKQKKELKNLKYQKIIPIEKFTSDNGHFSYHTFLIPVEQEFVPTLNHEHRGYCWVPLKDHPRPLHPGVWRSFKFSSITDKLKTMETVLSDVGFDHKISMSNLS